MRELKELLRLVLTSDLSDRKIAKLRRCSHNTVIRYRRRLQEEELSWEAVAALDEHALDTRLNDGRARLKRRFADPDWAAVHAELHRPGVTLRMRYEEYAQATPDGAAVSETEFRRRYTRYARSLGLVMRQVHPPGQCLFVDFSGKRPQLTDPRSGERSAVELFVAVMGASRRVFALAVPSQRLPDWIDAHVQALEYLGAAPACVVPDNLKSAVIKRTRADGPLLNVNYLRFADHYGLLILPARPRHPRDKGPVELAVKIVQRLVLGRLRNRTFYSLAELNQAIRAEVDALNARPMRHLGGKTRDALFAELDQPAMKPLPIERYEYGEWRLNVPVGPDYHVSHERCYYSVPYQLRGSKVTLKSSSKAITIYHNETAVALHPKLALAGSASTLSEHRAPEHLAYARDASVELMAWAEQAGEAVAAFLRRHLLHHRQPRAAQQAARGLRALMQVVGAERLNAACRRALALGSLRIDSVRSILQRGLENKPLNPPDPVSPPGHENVRGSDYYH